MITKEKAIDWLTECAKYFENRPTGGEDKAHWANVYNSKNASDIAELLRAETNKQ